MSVQRRIDAFLTLADRGVRAANVLFDEDLFEDATLYVQQVVERVARANACRCLIWNQPQSWSDGGSISGAASL
jgi:hypothetical protein